jgi:phage-related protein
MVDQARPVVWIGSSRRDLRGMPQQVRRNIGQALYAAQQGTTDPAATPLKGFGGVRVMEIVERYRADAYRAIYTAHFENAVYVLHVSRRNRSPASPRRDMKSSLYADALPKHSVITVKGKTENA